ncbi:hypothetical protein H9P43_007450 [Blastocladiella emersonii ATCC 22665]|nr:hypothetical protein H9P43_007450 [Blastocladiella emersonii ATCC 22665]
MVTAFTVQNLVLLNPQVQVAVLVDFLQIDEDEKRGHQVAMVDGMSHKHQETLRATAVRRLFGQVTGVIAQALEVFYTSDSYLSQRAPKFSSFACDINSNDAIRQVELSASSGINEIAMPSPLLLRKDSLDGADAAAAGKSLCNSRRASTESGLNQRSAAESRPAASSAAFHESHGYFENAAPPAAPFRDCTMKIVESQWFSVATFLAILFSIVMSALDKPEYRLERSREKDSVMWDLYYTGDVVLEGSQRAWLATCKDISSLRARPLHQAPEKLFKVGRAVGIFLLKYGDCLKAFVTANTTSYGLLDAHPLLC